MMDMYPYFPKYSPDFGGPYYVSSIVYLYEEYVKEKKQNDEALNKIVFVSRFEHLINKVESLDMFNDFILSIKDRHNTTKKAYENYINKETTQSINEYCVKMTSLFSEFAQKIYDINDRIIKLIPKCIIPNSDIILNLIKNDFLADVILEQLIDIYLFVSKYMPNHNIKSTYAFKHNEKYCVNEYKFSCIHKNTDCAYCSNCSIEFSYEILNDLIKFLDYIKSEHARLVIETQNKIKKYNCMSNEAIEKLELVDLETIEFTPSKIF
ncbi:MAG: hypothetical protein EBQ92_09170 [Proteobacteria bacterium]|nr:hypothetical protein [Pseudomonadota bacterium]